MNFLWAINLFGDTYCSITWWFIINCSLLNSSFITMQLKECGLYLNCLHINLEYHCSLIYWFYCGKIVSSLYKTFYKSFYVTICHLSVCYFINLLTSKSLMNYIILRYILMHFRFFFLAKTEQFIKVFLNSCWCWFFLVLITYFVLLNTMLCYLRQRASWLI